MGKYDNPHAYLTVNFTNKIHMPDKCDNRKLSKVYRYCENYIGIAREFDTISNVDIVSNYNRYNIDRTIFLSNFIDQIIFLAKHFYQNLSINFDISIVIYQSKRYFYQNLKFKYKNRSMYFDNSIKMYHIFIEICTQSI